MKKDWVATPDALASLVSWLDPAGQSEGASYVAMHGRLAAYFTRKGVRTPDELADETLTRVARRLHEEGTIAGVAPAQYCYIVARFVWLEHLRSPEYAPPAVLRDVPAAAPRKEDEEERERWLACLDQCLHQLEADERTIILEYYAGGTTDRIENRRRLASRLGVTANALTIRASRLRERLRTGVRQCLSGR